MKWSDISRDLAVVCRIVEAWQAGGPIDHVERDLALDKLRRAYEAVKFPSSGEVAHKPEPSVEPVVETGFLAELSNDQRSSIARDLFGGDSAIFESELARLDRFASLDEAMVYIYENHHEWNPDSPAVTVLVDLLTRKLA